MDYEGSRLEEEKLVRVHSQQKEVMNYTNANIDLGVGSLTILKLSKDIWRCSLKGLATEWKR